jgi:outer membrane protein
MKVRRALLSLTLGALFAAALPHQPRAWAADTPRAMTLREALDYAHAHEPTIQAALSAVAAADADSKVPRAEWQPVLGASAQLYAATANNSTAQYVGTDSVTLPRIGGTPAVTDTTATFKPYASSFVGVGITQEVFDFGRIAAQAAALDAATVSQKHAADARRLDVELGVEEAYFGVYAAKGVLAASEDAYTRAKAHRDLAKAGVSSGLRSPIELTRAEADLARYDIGRIRANGGVRVALSVLAAAIGSPDLTVDVSGPAPTPAELPPLSEAIRAAAAKDPVLAEAVANLAAQEKTSKALAAQLRPNLFATGTFSGRAGGAPAGGVTPDGSGFVPDLPNWDVGLVLSWTLFDGVYLAQRDASRAREHERKAEVAVAQEREVANVTQSYVRVTVARDAVPALHDAVRGAVANYAQADARFQSGLGNAVELADAEAIRTDADVELALGLFEVARARAAFGRAIAEGL